LQIETDLLLILTGTADKLSWATNSPTYQHRWSYLEIQK